METKRQSENPLMCLAPTTRQKTEKTNDVSEAKDESKPTDDDFDSFDSPGERRPTDYDSEMFPRVDLPKKTRDMIMQSLEEHRRQKEIENQNADNVEGIGKALFPSPEKKSDVQRSRSPTEPIRGRTPKKTDDGKPPRRESKAKPIPHQTIRLGLLPLGAPADDAKARAETAMSPAR